MFGIYSTYLFYLLFTCDVRIRSKFSRTNACCTTFLERVYIYLRGGWFHFFSSLTLNYENSLVIWYRIYCVMRLRHIRGGDHLYTKATRNTRRHHHGPSCTPYKTTLKSQSLQNLLPFPPFLLPLVSSDGCGLFINDVVLLGVGEELGVRQKMTLMK